MAKVSIDVEEIKKGLKATALTAKSQLTELAKKAQKDFSQKEVLKRIDHIVAIVKSQEFMKNPKVVELTKKVVSLSEQLERSVEKNASQLLDQVKAQVNAKLGRTAGKAQSAADTVASKVNSVKKAATKKTKSN